MSDNDEDARQAMADERSDDRQAASGIKPPPSTPATEEATPSPFPSPEQKLVGLVGLRAARAALEGARSR